MAILITVGFFIVLLATIGYAGYRFYARPGRVYEQLGGQATFSMPQVDRLNESEPGLLVTITEHIGETMPINPLDATSIRRDLIAAGYRSDKALAIYVGIRVMACALLVILALVFRSMLTTNPVLAVVIPVGAGVLGYFGPSFVLDHLIGSRQERIRWGLPDALDLLVVSVEAGLGLDQAIQHVSRELTTVHPDVADELELVNLEIRGGQRRVDALATSLSERANQN